MRFQTVSTVYRSAGADDGQATVEFAIVFAAFIVVVVAYGVLWDVLKDGIFVEHALQSASHHLQLVFQGAWGDILAY